MVENLRRHAAAEGIDFAPRSPDSLLVNTHRALAASVFAQTEAPERAGGFHHALFLATFCDGRNIGDPAVLREIAAASGLDAERMEAALEAGSGEEEIRRAADEARRRNITAVPAFVFGDGRVLVGAHPTPALVQAAQRAAAEG